jgi:hypothetical protein
MAMSPSASAIAVVRSGPRRPDDREVPLQSIRRP